MFRIALESGQRGVKALACKLSSMFAPQSIADMFPATRHHYVPSSSRAWGVACSQHARVACAPRSQWRNVVWFLFHPAEEALVSSSG